MPTATKNHQYTTVSGIFKNGVAVPSTTISLQKPLPVLITFTEPIAKNDEFPDSQWVPLKEYEQELKAAGYNKSFIVSAVQGYKNSKFYKERGNL